MSWSYATTIDAAPKLVIQPDWSERISQVTTYRTEITRSRKGLEQRTRHARRPVLVMEYTTQAHDALARRRIEEALAEVRGPIIVPWWPNGATLRNPMLVTTAAILDADPIAEDWRTVEWIYIWHRLHGGEWRQLAGLEGSTATLVGGAFTLYPVGSFVWPGRLATRSAGEEILQVARDRTATDRLTFQTL